MHSLKHLSKRENNAKRTFFIFLLKTRFEMQKPYTFYIVIDVWHICIIFEFWVIYYSLTSIYMQNPKRLNLNTYNCLRWYIYIIFKEEQNIALLLRSCVMWERCFFQMIYVNYTTLSFELASIKGHMLIIVYNINFP